MEEQHKNPQIIPEADLATSTLVAEAVLPDAETAEATRQLAGNVRQVLDTNPRTVIEHDANDEPTGRRLHFPGKRGEVWTVSEDSRHDAKDGLGLLYSVYIQQSDKDGKYSQSADFNRYTIREKGDQATEETPISMYAPWGKNTETRTLDAAETKQVGKRLAKAENYSTSHRRKVAVMAGKAAARILRRPAS
jgi:hypothetical protein